DRARVILGLAAALTHLDAEFGQIVTQFDQRTVGEHAAQIPGRVGRDLAAADADEDVLVLASQRVVACSARGLAEALPCLAYRVARRAGRADLDQTAQRPGVRRRHQQATEK